MSVPRVVVGVVEQRGTCGFCAPPMADDLDVLRSVRVGVNAVDEVPAACFCALGRFVVLIDGEVASDAGLGDGSVFGESDEASDAGAVDSEMVWTEHIWVVRAIERGGGGVGGGVFGAECGFGDGDGTAGDPLVGVHVEDGATGAEGVGFAAAFEGEFSGGGAPLIDFRFECLEFGLDECRVNDSVFVTCRGVNIAHVAKAGVDEVVISLGVVFAEDVKIEGLVLVVGRGVHPEDVHVVFVGEEDAFFEGLGGIGGDVPRFFLCIVAEGSDVEPFDDGPTVGVDEHAGVEAADGGNVESRIFAGFDVFLEPVVVAV